MIVLLHAINIKKAIMDKSTLKFLFSGPQSDLNGVSSFLAQKRILRAAASCGDVGLSELGILCLNGVQFSAKSRLIGGC